MSLVLRLRRNWSGLNSPPPLWINQSYSQPSPSWRRMSCYSSYMTSDSHTVPLFHLPIMLFPLLSIGLIISPPSGLCQSPYFKLQFPWLSVLLPLPNFSASYITIWYTFHFTSCSSVSTPWNVSFTKAGTCVWSIHIIYLARNSHSLLQWMKKCVNVIF